MTSILPSRDSLPHAVVTGLGAVSPNGLGKDAYWKALREGKSGVSRIHLFDPSALPCQIAGQVDTLPPPTVLSDKELRHAERITLMALLATDEALRDAGLTGATLSARQREIGVLVGTGGGAVEFAERQYADYFSRGIAKVSPWATVTALVGMLSSEISLAFGLRGFSHVLSTGCTSSTDAVGYALQMIRLGVAPVVITGGAEACITASLMAAFCKMGAVSTHWNGSPERASRPFDRDRDGFVLGEGAWILVLEEERHARERGAPIYAELKGYASTCDAHHRVRLLESGEEDARAMRAALRDADLTPESVDYVNLHGTSTPLNDRTETTALKLCFGPRASAIPMSATKSLIGHPQGACGAAGLVATLLAMEHNFLPPTINYDTPDPACDLDYIPNVGREGTISTALCNAISFGSKNSVLVLTRPPKGQEGTSR